MKYLYLFLLKLYSFICRIHNRRYVKNRNISKTVKFCPEFPGFVNFLNFKNIIVGEYTVINKRTHINPGKAMVHIGKYCHFGQGLTMYAFNHRYKDSFTIPYDNRTEDRNIEIGDFVWFGANVTVVPGVKIGEGVIAGAGSIITKNIPDCAIIGGNPAQIIKYRDKDLFYKLKQEQKYF